MQKSPLSRADEELEPPPAAGPPRILVAEDDRELRDLLVLSLRRDGYHVEEVATGYDLLLLSTRPDVRGTGFDLIVSDVRLPGLSGFEVVAGLRNPHRPRSWTTPVIFITAFGEAEVHAEAKELGSMLFNKPFDIDDLRTCVTVLLEHARGDHE